jgi:predicted O-linked N-acetylglucosamine transferase (SPINDLY family)
MAKVELACGKLLKSHPQSLAVINILGAALLGQGKFQQAVNSYNKAIQLKPDYAAAYSNRGLALDQLGQLEEAMQSYDKAIQLKPDFPGAHSNRGVTLKDLGLLEEAMQSYDKAIQLKPDYGEAYSNLLMSLNYIPNHNPIDHIAMARKFGKIVTEKAKPQFSDYQCLPTPERLRVGLVSSDLRNHPIGYFLESVLSSMDPSKIELIAYPTTPVVDDLTERIKPSFSMWKPIYGQTDEAAANMIYADGVHILLDLSGHTAGNRLSMFGYKPSPVQVSWLGYFATTGLNEMDYLIGDPYVTPPKDDDQFTEKVWRLPETRWCFTPPNVDVEVSVPPAMNHGYVTFGSFNNITKVNDKVVALWTKVLEAVPNSRLLLKATRFHDQMARESIIQRFAAHGIDSKRISLEESEDRQKYFAAYNKIDITLDPFPFTGGTTSVESLWMGVPLVTLAGDSLISRQGVGVLMNAGLPDWIADDEESYLAKAILFGSDLDKLASLRAGLRSQVLASPLFDAPRFARNFENALLEMWNQQDRQR